MTILRRRAGAVSLAAAVAIAVICAGGAVAAHGTPLNADAPPPPAEPLRVVLFTSPGCSQCRQAEKHIAAAVAEWGERIRVERFSTHEAVGSSRMAAFKAHYGLPARAEPPLVFVGRNALTTARQIALGLNRAIAEELAAGRRTFDPADAAGPPADADEEEAARQERIAWLQKAGPWAVAGAGLLDGVNPCAFTTIVFLLSMLSHLGKSRRQLAVVGVGFTAAVFATYMLLGLGLLWAVKTFSVNRGIATGLTAVVGALALALAAWSFVDYVRTVRGGHASKASLGLPKPVRARINQVIRRGLTTRNLAVGAVAVGFLVAVLESVCTGQTYVPTITLMVRTPALRASAVAYLALYNLMFILPLVGILVVAWFGVKSETLARLMQRHLGAVKLAMAILFTALGALVLATL